MKKNIGSLDKIIRVLIGLVIVALYFAGLISGTLAITLLAIAVIFILTTIFGTCPIYLMLGMSSKKERIIS
jgi:hypothetical protein